MQHTLKTTTETITGTGLHTGAKVSLRILPAVPDTGIRFVRTDLSMINNYVHATYDSVELAESKLCTMLKNNAGASVQTPEHLMAALAGCGIDNALIEIDGPEVPLMDGCSKTFTNAILKAGIKTQPANRASIKILKSVRVTDGDKFAEIRPHAGHGLTIDYTVNFQGLGTQHRMFHLADSDAFVTDIAPARTFTLRSVAEALKASGGIKGGSLENALVLNDEDGTPYQGAFVNGWKDEPVRHKILDAIGDLALAGKPIHGLFVTARGGHALTNRLLRALLADKTAYEIVYDLAGMPVNGHEKHLASAAAC